MIKPILAPVAWGLVTSLVLYTQETLMLTYERMHEINRYPSKLMLWIARIFGTRFLLEDDGLTLVGYRFRNTLYITEAFGQGSVRSVHNKASTSLIKS